jgi:hypothetical protein
MRFALITLVGLMFVSVLSLGPTRTMENSRLAQSATRKQRVSMLRSGGIIFSTHLRSVKPHTCPPHIGSFPRRPLRGRIRASRLLWPPTGITQRMH